MPQVLVTGASGFIGGHVVQVLLERGWKVRALRRASPTPSLPQSPVGMEWVTGDLRSASEMLRASTNCQAVFHVAADYRLWVRNSAEIYESNVQGTINVLSAARKNGVEKVVYTSSVGALGLNADGRPADENTPVSLDDMIGHYKRSKYLAEREAEKFLLEGLPIVMVHPSTPVGPGDIKPTPTGKIIVDYLNGRMPAYLNTGLNLVHVRDVAEGHALAFERGIVGEKYILGNQNLTLEQIFAILEKLSQVKAPRVRLPYHPILWLAHVFSGVSALTGKEPLIPLEGVKMAKKFMFFDSSKAVKELGMPQTPVEQALQEAVTWFRTHGYDP